jgi:hypothetical protein
VITLALGNVGYNCVEAAVILAQHKKVLGKRLAAVR